VVPSEDWRLDDPTTQDHIYSLCAARIRRGKKGRSFTVFSSSETLDALVYDVTSFLACFGRYLRIHNLNDSELDQAIGDFIVITAIQKNDAAALDWVATQCRDMVTSLGNRESITLDENTLPQVLRVAKEEVCRLVEDDILPISPQAFIEHGIYKALAENGVLGAAENLELRSRQYKELQVQGRLFRGMVYLNSHGACITQGILELSRMPRVHLALTYGEDGRRQPSKSVIADLRILKPIIGRPLDLTRYQGRHVERSDEHQLANDPDQEISSFDSNLSFRAIHPLQSSIAKAFANKIRQILQNPTGQGQMITVLLKAFCRLRTDFFRDLNEALFALEKSLRSISDPIGNIHVEANNLSNRYLTRTGLDSHDHDVLKHLVTLYLAVKKKEYGSMQSICEKLCATGIEVYPIVKTKISMA